MSQKYTNHKAEYQHHVVGQNVIEANVSVVNYRVKNTVSYFKGDRRARLNVFHPEKSVGKMSKFQKHSKKQQGENV